MALMEEFTYQAVSPTGGPVVKGTLEASGANAVALKLRAQGLMPLKIQAVSKTGLNRDVKLFNREGRVKVKPLALFAKQMAGLINAGLPLMRSLSVLIEQTEDASLRSALTAVHADLETGHSFSAALAKQPHAFPPLMVNLVKVGETGGFMGDSLELAAKSYGADAELQDKLKAASTYPMVVLVIAVLAVIGMIAFIVPIFEGMFASMGGELPLPTQILVTMSHNMVWLLPLLIVAVVAFWFWWMRNRNTEAVRKVIDPYKLKMPIFGTLMTKVAVARFSRNLSMMLAAGVPLLQALSTVGKASNNWAIEQAVLDVQKSVREGRSFAAPLAKAAVFPPIVAQMVSVGEESGTLPDMLASIADMYEAEAKTATDQLASTIEPILIVMIGLLIGSMVLALYMPIFGIYSQLAEQ
ncbi:MAG TPA: type II secretion system F family protein [Propionicimonas sp.]|nr:type II secretion system F family protein [Propionicimonas sp.]HQA78394.1 type II secretion system F family protein [Propionicimonas sp.]HQD97959.1 type II secretion system F family protein [Propionicimonas sp.]